jgi:hypothetical protein
MAFLLKHFSAITALQLSVCLIGDVLEHVPFSPCSLCLTLNSIQFAGRPSNFRIRDLRGGGRIGSNGKLSHSKSFRGQDKKRQRLSPRDVRSMAPPIDDSDDQKGDQKKVRKKTGKLLRERLTWKNPHAFGKKLSLRQARSVRSELDIARTCQASLDRIEWIRQSAQPRLSRPAPRFVAQHISKEVNITLQSILPQKDVQTNGSTRSPARSRENRFVPAPYFNGAMAGFEFRIGSRGSGYYAIRSRPSSSKHNRTRLVGTAAPDTELPIVHRRSGSPLQPTRHTECLLGMEYGDEGSSELEERILRGDKRPSERAAFTLAGAPAATDLDGDETAAVATLGPAVPAASHPIGDFVDALDRVRVAGTGQTLREWRLAHAGRAGLS